MKNKLMEMYEELQKDNYVKNLSKATMESYGSWIKQFIAWCEKQRIRHPAKINDDVIKEYKLFLRLRDVQVETINGHLKGIRRLLNFSQEFGCIKKAPKVVLMKEEHKVKPTLCLEEAEKIFRHCDLSTPSVMAVLYLGIGVRSRTMCNIKVSDINFDDKLLTCRVTKNRKTLILPLTSSVEELLFTYIEIHKKKPDDWLFTNSNGGQFRKTSMYTTLNKFYAKCGIYKTGVHLLRHTFGKMMARNHCDAFTLQHWFGHSKLDESRKYVNLFANDLAASVETVNPTAGRSFINN